MDALDAPRVNLQSELRDGGEAFFELRFSPSAALIATVRQFVTDFYTHVLGDADVSDRLAMATHELLENTVRYGIDGKSELDIVVHRKGEIVDVRIATRNRARPEQLARATEALEGVVRAADPASHYLTLVHRAAKRTDGGSGLGLGRIRAEADLALAYEITGDVLRIHATGTFHPSQPIDHRPSPSPEVTT